MQWSGAVSHARFMAKALYIMKIYMTCHQCQQVERITKFTFFLHAKYFLQAMLPAPAPHYLELWENVQ